MDGLPDNFTLDFKRSENGLWFVTCEKAVNVFISHHDLRAILTDLPNVLQIVSDHEQNS